MMNSKADVNGNLTFQDYKASSAKLEIGSAIEIPIRGPYTSKRYIVVAKGEASTTMHAFVAVPV